MIKGSIHQEGITIVTVYVPNIGTPKCMKQILTEMKREIHSNTIIVRNFNTPLSTMDRSSGQRINKATVDLNNTTD